MTFDKDTYLAAVAERGAAFGAIAAAGDLDTGVPGCPDWNLRQLVGHLGWVYNWVSDHIERRAVEVLSRREAAQPPAGDAVVDWYDAGHARVLAALAGIHPAEAVWGWAGNDGAFWQRRMAHETLVHCWDAESSVGEPRPLAANLAADGVEEQVQTILPFQVKVTKGPVPEGSLHLHRTDGDGEWLCRVVDGGFVLERAHARGDAAVRGTAEQLDLLLWQRVHPGDLETFGDAGVLASWTGLSR